MHISSNGVFCGPWWNESVKPKKRNSDEVVGNHEDSAVFTVKEKMLEFPALLFRISAFGRGDSNVLQSILLPWSSLRSLILPSRHTQGNALNNLVSKWSERLVLPPRASWKDKSLHQNLPNANCPFLTFRQEKEYLYSCCIRSNSIHINRFNRTRAGCTFT